MTRREAPVSPPVVLSIAGSDSGGGAGIQADVKTIEACGGFGTSAITSVTAQNTRGVQGSHLLPIEDVDAQIEAVRADFDLAAVKTGMLATTAVVELVADHAETLPNLVVDPVMVAASGDRLLDEDAEAAYGTLAAEATLVTPNADEAEVLTDVAVDDAESAERAGRILVDEQGADAALVKGGHVPGDHVVDTLIVGTDSAATGDDPGVTTFRHERVDTDATHGSGCTLSAAIATRLAHGDDLVSAVGAGIDLLARAVRYNVAVGEGPGAIHHLVELRNDASRAPTVDLVAALADRVGAVVPDALVPPEGVGLVGATPHAEEPADVAAVVGRTAAEGGGGEAASTVPIRYGADDALASVLLAAREVDPALRVGALVAAAPAAVDGLDGPTVALDDVGHRIDDPTPLPPTALAELRTGAESPVAVPIDDRPSAGDPERSASARAIVVGSTVDELLDRLGSL